MKIQTMSIVVGSTACNAHCPMCVSKQTPPMSVAKRPNWRNFVIACKLAKQSGATTVLMTGKGEPTLFPDLITDYLRHLQPYDFPFVEMQTNGIKIGNMELDEYLCRWYEMGLTTIALSAVETGVWANKKIYSDNYPPLEDTAETLNSIGFTVRLSIMMMKRYICTPRDVDRVIEFCKAHKIKQLTLRPIARVLDTTEVTQWVTDHTLSDKEVRDIYDHVVNGGTPVLHLAHGATVFDYNGQNLCLSNCLTTNDTDDNMRQIIYYPDGTIGYDWMHKGAVLL